MANIGFIGLGHMGQPMAMNLLKAGHTVKVYDMRPEALRELIIAGADEATSIPEVVSHVDVVFTMLQTGAQVMGCCLGLEGIFANIANHALFIDCSSIDIKDSRSLHIAAKEIGLAMVDAPVSGGVKGAQAASLTIMVGGNTENFARAKPYLEILGRRVIHAGAPGNGQAAKICNNMVLAISMIAVSEAFSLGEKLGLEAKTFYEIANNASAQCWVLSNYVPVPDILENVPANNNYQPGFTAEMMLKDLNLSQVAAQSVTAQVGLAAKATEIYRHYVDSGSAQKDFSGIFQMIDSGYE